MNLLPGWSALATVTEWHRVFEISGILSLGLLVILETLSHISRFEARKRSLDAFGIISLAALVLFETLAYQYNQRRDLLTTIVQQERESSLQSDYKSKLEALGRKIDDPGKQKQIDNLQDDLGKAHIQLQDLKSQSVDRSISQKQREYVVRRLKSHAGRKVRVWSIQGDSEASRYAQQIANLLDAAGLKIVEINNPQIAPRDFDGVHLWLKRLQKMEKPDVDLCAAFEETRIGCYEDVVAEGEASTSLIVVGHKPKLISN